jgi:putative ABC transport system permease protein
MDTFLTDIRYGLRTLLRNRGVTFAAVLCLALGIGVNTTVFTVVYGILLRPLPFEGGERVITLWGENQSQHQQGVGLTFDDLQAYRASGAFEVLGGYSGRNFALTDGEQSERVEGSSVTPNLFGILGARPVLGRTFVAGDAAAAGFEQTVILSDILWKRRFAGDPGIVGRAIRVNDRALTVIGVMPPGFQFPARDEIWLPLGRPAGESANVARYILAVGRLPEGTTVQEAQQKIDPLSTQMALAAAATHDGWSARIIPYRDSVVDSGGQLMLWMSLGAVAFVLLIACANVANLLLARSADRQREMAVRLAMGASRARVLRQLLTESVMLSLTGAALGAVIAVWWTDHTIKTIPEQMAYWIRFDFDGHVLLFTFGIAIATGILFGLLPALQATTGDLHVELKEGTRTTGETAPRARLRSALVVSEIALSLVLLVGAALMMQSFLRVQRASLGFDSSNMMSLRFTMPGDRFDDERARAQAITRLAAAVRAVPGVKGAGITTSIPADDGGIQIHALAATRTATPQQMREAPNVSMIGVGDGWFDALGLALDAGRDFSTREVGDSAAHVAILGRTIARELFPKGAVGQRILLGDSATSFAVIGVVADLQYEEFMETTDVSRLQVYVPYAQTPWRTMAMLVPVSRKSGEMTQAIVGALHDVDPLVAPFEVQTMDARRDYTQWPSRVFGGMFASFGVIALVLALTGIYGVMAYTVSRQKREIGIRIAVGAAPIDIMRKVMTHAGRLSALGIIIGGVASVFITRLLAGMLFGVDPNDLRTFVAVPALLAVTALLASYIPARRASRVDPMEALRSE